MNFEILGVFLLLAALSLSILAVAVGFTVRVFLTPLLKEYLSKRNGPSDAELSRLVGTLDRIEDRIDTLEAGLDRVTAAQDFDLRLAPKSPEDRKTS